MIRSTLLTVTLFAVAAPMAFAGPAEPIERSGNRVAGVEHDARPPQENGRMQMADNRHERHEGPQAGPERRDGHNGGRECDNRQHAAGPQGSRRDAPPPQARDGGRGEPQGPQSGRPGQPEPRRTF
ncbi:hypothetical protein [Ponticaulis sp.]|uniref:hypothetical protein n=1 Tax=Ponticaulis sp. TaxID=2020902 RepID=UPI000B7233E2|nr:hypothetical protein [Ponticaulis sp.]MAI90663.1 hypothetical protein [Ponticaulis sp.]OUX99172.1 MAG: hypothetical protein CBB65_09505 [Hyphomonadaceae bacterium TMED5]|tara:strand:+ start:43573 stop:43950 length:378 start_codon:yes stop_codon:yes gene_type:complete